MSQKKVDAYKAEKARRRETVESNKKKQKVRSLGAKIAGLVLAAGIVVALVITGINSYKSYKNSLPAYDISEYAVQDYSGMLATEAPETESAAPTEDASAQTEDSAAESEAGTTEAD